MIYAVFSPGPDPRDNIINVIEHAFISLDIALSYFTDETIWDAILDILATEIPVRLLLDRHEIHARTAIYKRYIEGHTFPGLTVKITTSKGYMHNNFCLCDGYILVTGSYNWTYYAGSRNAENLFYAEGEPIQDAYQAEFEKLWSLAI
jgi:phosphatidylserine/phosphatidylglycerophosphate/cardiolipin synthase-like enzyme